MKRIVLLLAMVFMTVSVSAQELWRVVTAEQIKDMNQFQRVQYNKALDLLRKDQFRAAATEFERFIIQHNDSDVLPYMIFMRAYSLHRAKDRNQAINVYNEVLDFYPDEVNAAAPALYYRGVAALDNGDYSAGIKSMKELVDDEEYRTHPVAATALLSLVHNYWRLNDTNNASRYLKQIFRDFRKSNPNAADEARKFYTASCLSTGKTAEYASWYQDAYAETAAEKSWTPEQMKMNMANAAYDVYMHNYHWFFVNNDLMKKYRAGAARGPDPGKETWTILSGNKASYDKAGAEWDYFIRAIRLLADKKYIPSADFERLVADTCAYVAKTADDEKNKGRQQRRYAEIFDTLLRGWRLDQASYVNSRITNEKTRAWNEFNILVKREKWEDAIRQLDTMQGKFKDDAGTVKSIGWNKADILRDRMKKYDEAIQLYRSISDPPGTLWAIVECHKRKGDGASVIAQLIEIENAFPNDGPRAALDRAYYYHNTGNGEKAIATARYIMKKYPKSGQSSAAHQLLEQYGIDETGGGVLDDM